MKKRPDRRRSRNEFPDQLHVLQVLVPRRRRRQPGRRLLRLRTPVLELLFARRLLAGAICVNFAISLSSSTASVVIARPYNPEYGSRWLDHR